MSQGAFTITTPIYYVNGEPHIGHTYTTSVCDALARYHRLCGDDTFFLTGTDEHGEKILETAEQRGITPLEVADQYSAIFRETWERVGMSYDRFIRTTEPAHGLVVQGILQRLYDAGQIDFREYEGDYCVGCERFLTERDMLDGLCKDHERVPERRSESNYFFRMSEHFEWLESYLRENPDFVRPERYRNEALGMLRDESGLGDLCISRPKARLDWGIELPFDANYVCYVWFDALINYLSALGYPDGPDFERRWACAEHMIGKDILKPHAIFWPTMLHAMGVPLPRHIDVHGHWIAEDRKVSKSLGNLVSPGEMDEKYGFERFRFFLLREMAFGTDSNFSEELLIERTNSDLANNLGNLVSRALNMTARFADSRVPEPPEPEAPEQALREALEAMVVEIDERMRALELHRAIDALMRGVDAANRYLEQREPWKAAKDETREAEVRAALYTSCEALRILAIMLSPFLPVAAAEILDRLGLAGAAEDARLPEAARFGALSPGLTTRKGGPLFPRLELPVHPDAAAEGDTESA